MRIAKWSACLAPLFLSGLVLAQGSPKAVMPRDARAPEAPREAASSPQGAAPATGNTVQPEIAKALTEAQTLLTDKKTADAKAKIQIAAAVPNRSAYENYLIARLSLTAAIIEDDAANAEKFLTQAQELTQTGGWMKPEENLQLMQAVGIVNYRAKNYPVAATWLGRFLKAGGSSDNAKALQIQALYLGADYPGVVALVEEDNAKALKEGKAPNQAATEILAQAYDRQKDLAGSGRTLELLIKYYPKKEYWQSLTARLGAKPDFASRLQLNLLRLASYTGAFQEANDYSEYVDFAQRNGNSAEALKAYDQGAAAGFLGTGPKAAVDAKQRAKLVQEIEQDKKAANTEAANAAKKPDGTSMLRVGMNLVGLGMTDKGLELMEKGIAKGGLKRVEDAWLDLGIAYAMAGQNDKAAAAFAKVNGKEGLDELGRYWLLALRKPGA